MSYQVIARKWRPQTFEEVIGQDAITQTLRNAIEYDRLHHAYLFSGARGVGKTTTARLLAKALNCQKTDAPNPKPCDTSKADACDSCKEVADSRSLDVLEFDAASHTGVDDIREIILESINVNPARDRFKVFIIDEVHMLSTSSFNALLKTLEEPPPNVVFIMATTELHKVPDTILSRCQQFDFRTIALQKINARLKQIADVEKIDISDDALKEISRSGEGSMRDAQSNFDQVISFSGDRIEADNVVSALGIASAENLTKTIRAIADENPAHALAVVEDLVERGQDLRNFCRDLLTFIRDLLIVKIAGDADNLLESAILSHEELHEQSAPFLETDLIRFFNSIAETESKMRDATEPRYLLEIGLIKLIEMRKIAPIEELLERLSDIEERLSDSSPEDPQSTEADVIPEKKTLAPEDSAVVESSTIEAEADGQAEKLIPATLPPVEQSEPEIPVEPKIEIQKESKAELEDKVSTATDEHEATAAATLAIDPAAMPVRLEPISGEDLEHVDDKRLDNEFEEALKREGDDLKIFSNANELLSVLLNREQIEKVGGSATNGSAQGTAAGAAPAKENRALDIVNEMANVEEADERAPDLPENPSEDDLRTFAEDHPKVKKVMRLFRGKLVSVERKQD